MVFVDNISDLEYYHPNPRFGCYGDTVFEPHDILLQANGFVISGDYVFGVAVCDTAGNPIEDGTSYFDQFLGSFIVSGVVYYYINIRCNDFSPYMLSHRCFTLHIVVTNPFLGITLFDKYTQKYTLSQTATTFVPSVLMDGQPLPNCIVGSSDAANCNFNFIKFKSTFDCIDKFTGDYYGPASAIIGTGDYPFQFERFSWIEGRIRKVPANVKRTISINCRTQKTEVTPPYLLTGSVTFPVWKVEEIEQQLLANHLYVDDVEYQSEGGTVFEQFGKPYNCQYRYKLTMNLIKCQQWQIFGCVPSCDDLATYYALSRPYSRLYDDKQDIIATNNDELLIYFRSQPGYKSASELPFNMPCPVYGLFAVQSSGVLPKFLYVDEINPSARVFPKQLPVNTLDFAPLCNGITFDNQVPTPDVIGGESETVNVPIPDVVGGESQDANQYTLQITATDGFTLSPNYSSSQNYEGEVTLNISVSSTVVSSPLVDVPIATISGHGIPVTAQVIYGNDNPNLLPDSVLTIETDGTITYTGDATSVAPGTMYVEFFMVKYNING